MGFSTVVQYLPNMYKTLGSIHTTKRTILAPIC